MKNAKSTHTKKSKVIGRTVTDHSFLDDHVNAVKGATIDLSDHRGADFLNRLMKDKEMTLLGYMNNASGRKIFDFKTNGPNGETNWMGGNVAKSDFAKYQYRAGPVDDVSGLADPISAPTIATARDVGNIGAGYVAGDNGLNWDAARRGLDGLQKYQDRNWSSIEGQTTQLAEKIGFDIGTLAYPTDHPIENFFN